MADDGARAGGRSSDCAMTSEHRAAIKVEEGSSLDGDNRPSAEPASDEHAYFARKRSMAQRSAFVLVPIAAGLAMWSPMLGFDLALGGTCGVGNMLLIMRNNERLLTRGCSRSAYGLRNTLRILIVGLVPVFAATHHPWWYMLMAIAGFFAPLVVYSFQLRRELSTG
jgi:hypothetical protein